MKIIITSILVLFLTGNAMANDPRSEGWLDDNYVILFSEAETESIFDAYGLNSTIHGYRLVGILSWDNFIVKNSKGEIFKIPTVPAISKYLEPVEFNKIKKSLNKDDRLTNKIKWYIKPIIFGGDPELEENITWVSIEDHTKLVKWWNEKYLEMVDNKNQP
jgi:hypothetical protein